MLHRKIYQFCMDGQEVCIFLRDQQRWIDNVSRKLASVSRTNPDINVSEDCPEAEQLYPHSPDSLD